MERTIASHIEVTPGVCGGKPRIAGTRVRVQDIYVWHELQGRSPEEIVADFRHLTLADVYAALAYYFDHRETIDAQMKAGEELVAAMMAKHISKLPPELTSESAGGSSVSP